MKLIETKVQDDYGKDYYLTILKLKNRWCLSQMCLSTGIYGRSWPYLNITMGSGRFFGFSFQIYKFGATIELFSRSWFK
jgi:hypothetical protein